MKSTFKHAMIAGAVALAMGTAGICAADDSTNSRVPQDQPAAANNTAGHQGTMGSANTAPAKPLTGKQKATAFGAGTGALAGAAVGGPVGAAVGAVAGGVIGHEGTDANGHVTNTPSNGSKSWSGDEQVRKAQSALNDQGYNVQVDGVMGPQTEGAIRSYQEKNGLTASGTLDDATLRKLDAN
jgi:outer membrane lipoprotein SlyB